MICIKNWAFCTKDVWLSTKIDNFVLNTGGFVLEIDEFVLKWWFSTKIYGLF